MNSPCKHADNSVRPIKCNARGKTVTIGVCMNTCPATMYDGPERTEEFKKQFVQVGLGDVVHKIMSKTGRKPCGLCKKIENVLNRVVPNV